VLLETPLEMVRASAEGREVQSQDLIHASVMSILDLDERVAALENMSPGAALVSLRWNKMTLNQRRQALDSSQAQQAAEPQNPEA
jgi:hypothetical protein